jgi:hypothetical protein
MAGERNNGERPGVRVVGVGGVRRAGAALSAVPWGRPSCGRVPMRKTKSCAGDGHYGEGWGLLIRLPHKRDREARAILRMPPHGAACRRLPPTFSTCFFGAWCLHKAIMGTATIPWECPRFAEGKRNLSKAGAKMICLASACIGVHRSASPFSWVFFLAEGLHITMATPMPAQGGGRVNVRGLW